MAGNPNPSPATRFTKGDPRIWKGGRPKTFTALQELAQQIAHETAKAGGSTVTIDGHTATVAEMILRQWAQSKNPALQMRFIEVAFGKVPDKTEITGADGGPIPVKLFDYGDTVKRVLGPDDDQ